MAEGWLRRPGEGAVLSSPLVPSLPHRLPPTPPHTPHRAKAADGRPKTATDPFLDAVEELQSWRQYWSSQWSLTSAFGSEGSPGQREEDGGVILLGFFAMRLWSLWGRDER